MYILGMGLVYVTVEACTNEAWKRLVVVKGGRVFAKKNTCKEPVEVSKASFLVAYHGEAAEK